MKKLFVVGAMIAGAVALCATDFIVQIDKLPEAPNCVVKPMGSAIGRKFVQFTAKEATMSGKISVPEAGDYWVYVRDYSQGGKWRCGIIYLGDQKLGRFGDAPLSEELTPSGHHKHWQWTKAPFKVQLPAGEVEVKIVSTSANTRFNVLYFTTEDDADIEEINMKEVDEVVPEGYAD